MYDYGLSVLEQYGLTASSSARIRGALMCRTEQGPVVIKEFMGSEKKLKKQQELLGVIGQNGFLTDSYLENKDGELVSRNEENISYTVQHWYEGRECDVRSEQDIERAVRQLAGIHKVMKLPLAEYYMEPELRNVYIRHNQELRKIRKFIRKKGPSCPFEKIFQGSVEDFLEKGEEALEMLQDPGYERLMEKSRKEGTICHGEYNQHNILFTGQGAAVTNFGHWGFDIQMADLYRFMRKILEKNNWSLFLAEKMLDSYDRERKISGDEWKYLRVRFIYPDKYWKLANYYYTHKKAWISEKNTEKLEILIRQKDCWDRFGKTFFPERCGV